MTLKNFVIPSSLVTVSFAKPRSSADAAFAKRTLFSVSRSKRSEQTTRAVAYPMLSISEAAPLRRYPREIQSIQLQHRKLCCAATGKPHAGFPLLGDERSTRQRYN